NGRLETIGKSKDMIERYLAGTKQQAASREIPPPLVDHGVAIARIEVNGQASPSRFCEWSSPFRVSVEFTVTCELLLSIGVTIVNSAGVGILFSWVVFQRTTPSGRYRAEGEFRGEVLVPGHYYVNVHTERYGVERYQQVSQAAPFEIVDT